MASFMTMSGAGAGSGQIEYSIDNNKQGYSYDSNYVQSGVSLTAPCTAPGLYLMGVEYNATKTLGNLSWGGIVLQEKTLTPINNHTLKLALVVVSNGNNVASFTGGYAVPVMFSYFLAPYNPNVDYQQLYNDGDLKYTLDDLVYNATSSVNTSASQASSNPIALGDAGIYQIISITASANTSNHSHNVSANNGTVENFRQYTHSSVSSAGDSGVSIATVNAENNCQLLFYAANASGGIQLIMWIKKKS